MLAAVALSSALLTFKMSDHKASQRRQRCHIEVRLQSICYHVDESWKCVFNMHVKLENVSELYWNCSCWRGDAPLLKCSPWTLKQRWSDGTADIRSDCVTGWLMKWLTSTRLAPQQTMRPTDGLNNIRLISLLMHCVGRYLSILVCAFLYHCISMSVSLSSFAHAPPEDNWAS